MNIYQKIQVIKKRLMVENIKKSGYNKFSNFWYYELSDFVPRILEACDEIKLLTHFNFKSTEGILTIIDIEKSEDRIEYTVPMVKVDMNKCNEVQAIGGTMTYLKRYLYMNAFDIIEQEQFDSQEPKNKTGNIYKCEECEKSFEETIYKGIKFTPEQQYNKTINMHGRAICLECRERKF